MIFDLVLPESNEVFQKERKKERKEGREGWRKRERKEGTPW